MKCPKVLCFKTASRRIILAFSFLLAVSLANPLLFAQFTAAQPDAPGAQWQKWFYSQRSYGLGYIPENALANAVAQRDTAARRHYQKQDTVGAAASAAQWVSLGPSVINSPARGQVSGRLTSIAIDPINPANVYVASAGGGVWKSSNKGNGWIPLTDNLPSLASGAVAVDPFSSEVWYGTGELDFCRDCYYGAGVYRSPDGGVTWTRVAPDIFLSSATSLITFDPHNQGTIFMGRSSALWKSTDDGQTWASTLAGVITALAINPADSTVVYAGVGNASGDAANGVYKSTDGGQTWTRLAGGLPAQATIGRIALTVDPQNPSTVYALIARSSDYFLNGLFRSLDGGSTWAQITSLPPQIFQEDNFANGLYNMLIRVDPKNSAVLYAGSNDLYKSSDGGSTWQALNILEGEHDVVFDPSDLQTFYLINNSGVWKSSDGAQTFVDLNNTLSTALLQYIGLHPSNPNQAVAATQDNGVILNSGGFTWDQGRLGDSGVVFYEASNPQTIYASGHYTDLFRSDDGGKTWGLISPTVDATDRAQFYSPFIPVPGQRGWLYLGTQRLWFSSDQGAHWQALSADLTGGGSATISALAVAPSAINTIYAGTSDGRVAVSPDSGKTWALAAALPNRFVTSVAVHPQLPGRAFVGLSGFGTGHIFRTDNGGGSWTDISSNLPNVPVNAVLINASAPDTIYLGTDIGVFVLAADGTWTPLNQGIPNAVVLSLSQNASTGLLVAATHGRGAFALANGSLAPRIASLVNSVSLAPAALAPGMTASLLGANLAAGNAVPAAGTFPLPHSLLGTSVTVNGIAVPMLSVSPGRVDFLAPYAVNGALAQIVITTPSGQASVEVNRTDASPAILLNTGGPSIFHGGGILVTDAAPARAAEELVLYATGLGAVTPSVDNNFPTPYPAPLVPISKTLLQPIVHVGNSIAPVVFSGLTPGLMGTYQINFDVPGGLSGKVPVVVDMGSGELSAAALLSVGP